MSVGEVRAASITVDKSAVDDTNGTCELADAITAANTDTATNGCTAGSGADTISLGVNITLSAELPDITSEITIEGANYDIDGNDEYQIFYVDGGDLTLNNITLTGGDGGSFGGAIDTDGGSLTVTNSRLEDNEAGLLGGAIATDNTNVIIRNSVFVGNTSGSLGGALAFFSSVPSDRGWTDDMEIKTLLIDQTTFGEDVPVGCAAADISADPENFAQASGGALRLSGGDVTIRRSSFIGNHAGVDGGAIYGSAWRFLFENNTVSCNRADADGGGMYIIVGDLILRHSTIYQNSAGDEGGGLFTIDDTGRDQDNEEGLGVYLQNTIIAGSTGGGDCVARDTIDHNIGMYVGDGSCEPACSGTDGPLNIGSLQGEPAYHPLLDGSLAINRADQEVCSLTDSSDSSETVESQQVQDFSDTNICEELYPKQDQIGTNRPMYGSCDIGAIESRTGAEFVDPDDDDGETVEDTAEPDPPVQDTAVPVPPATDTPVPVPPPTDTPVPVPPPTDTPVPIPPPTDTPVPVPPPTDTPVPIPPPTDTPVPIPPPTDTPVPVPPPTDTPVPDPPVQDPPVQDPPATDTPVPDPPPTDTPVPDPPPTDTPVQDTAVPDPPVQDTAVPDPPVQDTAVPDAPVQDTAVPDPPVQDPPIQDPPTATDDGALPATATATAGATATASATAGATATASATGTASATATETLSPEILETCRNLGAAATQAAASLPSDDSNVQANATQAAQSLLDHCPLSQATATQAAIDLTATAIASDPEIQSPLDVPTSNQCVHAVVAGDTLFRLSLNYNTTVNEIKYLNQLTGDILYIGQDLFVPGCYSAPELEDIDFDFDDSNLLYLCQNLFESIVVRSSSSEISCRQIDTGNIDKHPLLASGMLGAVEVLGFVDQGVEVCFRSVGNLVFLDPVTSPPSPLSMPSYDNDLGMACGQVYRIGTVVLVSLATEVESQINLSTCVVTTTETLRLRDNPGGGISLGLVPYYVSLQATARTTNWFNVNFLGTEGWISASYVQTEGICE